MVVPEWRLLQLVGAGCFQFGPGQVVAPAAISTGATFTLYEVSVVAGRGSWWSPTVPSPQQPPEWLEHGGVEGLVATGDGIWTEIQQGGASAPIVRASALVWWIPSSAWAAFPLTPGSARGAVSGEFPAVAPPSAEAPVVTDAGIPRDELGGDPPHETD